MKRLLFFTICICGLLLSSQESPFSTTISYPLPIGNNFLSEYTGIVDVGVRYQFINENTLNFGLGLNAIFFTETTALAGVEFKDNFWLVQPKIMAELNTDRLDKLTPFFGVGYTLAGFKTTSSSSQVADNTDSFGGFNINLGAGYDFSKNWFVQLQYDYVRLFRDVLGDKSFANNLAILKLGVGYRF